MHWMPEQPSQQYRGHPGCVPYRTHHLLRLSCSAVRAVLWAPRTPRTLPKCACEARKGLYNDVLAEEVPGQAVTAAGPLALSCPERKPTVDGAGAGGQAAGVGAPHELRLGQERLAAHVRLQEV